MDDLFLVIRLADGMVVNATVGEPPAQDGYEAVPRMGAAADAWIGWTRADDGTFAPPPEPEAATEPDA